MIEIAKFTVALIRPLVHGYFGSFTFFFKPLIFDYLISLFWFVVNLLGAPFLLVALFG